MSKRSHQSTSQISQRFCVAFLLASACALFAEPVSAQETAPSAPFGALNPANWRMPEMKMPSFKTLMPQAEEKARITKKKDGLFSEVGQTASNSWNRTKQMFNPQKLNPVRFMTASSRTPSESKTETKPNFFQALFAPAPPPKSTETVTDFLGQDRPNP